MFWFSRYFDFENDAENDFFNFDLRAFFNDQLLSATNVAIDNTDIYKKIDENFISKCLKIIKVQTKENNEQKELHQEK